MIIHKPKIERIEDRIRISSFIEVESDNNLSKTLWFEVPLMYESWLSVNSNAFLIATISFAMCLRENINVEGTLSPRLVYNSNQYQSYLKYWLPHLYISRITCNSIKQEKIEPKATVLTFSGGVDSFYTLYKHLAENETIPEYRITHCLFTHGFDVNLRQEKDFTVIKNGYEKMLSNLNIPLISIASNFREFNDRKVPWHEVTFGPAVISTALILDKNISKFLVASHSIPISPCGSHPLTDHLLSTENLEVIHHGMTSSRLYKTKILSNWPVTYDYLRVCWEKTNGLLNCCECEKCLRTMIPLELTGTLSKYSTFPKLLKIENIKNWNYQYLLYASDILNEADKIGRSDISNAVKEAIKTHSSLKLCEL